MQYIKLNILYMWRKLCFSQPETFRESDFAIRCCKKVLLDHFPAEAVGLFFSM